MMQLAHHLVHALGAASMLLVLLGLPHPAASKVVGITIDVEGNIQSAMSNPGPATLAVGGDPFVCIPV
jgi:hypothetical protein